jgi:shikimate dehydrogenase
MRCAVLGRDVSRSLSPALHAAAARQLGIELAYEAVSCPTESSFLSALSDLQQAGATGVNVTHPYKLAALRWVDAATADARTMGSVNTIVLGPSTEGDNTDGPGLLRWWSTEPDDWFDAVQVLGSGGAARAVVWALARRRCRRIVVSGRSEASWARPWGIETAPLEPLVSASMVVNTLPPDADPVAWRSLGAAPRLVDLNYRLDRRPTELVRRMADTGRTAVDGGRMLAEQGALSMARWTGLPLEPIRSAMLAFIRGSAF